MLAEIITEIQSLGVRVLEDIIQRRGGAGPADAGSLLVRRIPVNVPLNSFYVANSPYSIVHSNGCPTLMKNGLELLPVEFIPRPRFYEYSTSEGVPYSKIALLHGSECLATTVLQRCMYWNSKKRCLFCGIELSLENHQTLEEKTPAQVAEVAMMAEKLDSIKHVVLTTGTQSPPGKEILSLASTAAAIKRTSTLPVHAQFLPQKDEERLFELKDAGVDTVGIHIESFDLEILSRTAPAKAALGIKTYEKAWKKAIEVFGPNRVSSFLLVGLGEGPESIINGSKILAELGVYPFVVPLRPIPGSLMEDAIPPDPDTMKYIYEKVAEILSEKGLSAAQSPAGCVRCGACSALSSFENEKGVDNLICHKVRTPEELEEAMDIRQEVFVKEQGLFEDTDRDDYDPVSIHLVAKLGEQVVGTVRVFPVSEESGHWAGGRLSVKKHYRTSGAGELLVQEAVKFVKRKGCTRFTAQIQEKNIPFFLKLGWKPVGPLEVYCGAPHQLMEADLQNNE